MRILCVCVLLSACAFGQVGRGENYYCHIGDVWAGASFDGPAHLPERCFFTGLVGTPSKGAVIQLASGSDVNAALAAANCGDTIELQAGGTFAPFKLPSKGCDAQRWITIRTSAPDSALPPEHYRVNPSYAGVASLPGRPPYSGGSSNVMAAVVSPDQNPAITDSATGVANYYRLGPGLEIARTPGTGTNYRLVVLDSNADHIILDRDWIHGSELYEESEAGVVWTGATYVAVINSYLNAFKCLAPELRCSDAKALAGGDGILPHWEGVWKAYNNFLEATGENILHGGGLIGNKTPTDLEYRENHMFKPLAWSACTFGVDCYIIKNLWECKNCARVLLEGNLMEGSYGGYSQKGFAVLLTPRGKWAGVNDVTIRYNHASHLGSVLALDATTTCFDAYLIHGTCPTEIVDSAPSGSYSLHDNLFDDVDGQRFKGSGNIQVMSEYSTNPPLHDVDIHNLTVAITPWTNILSLYTQPVNPQVMGTFTFRQNIVMAGTYGGVWNAGGAVCVKDAQPVWTFDHCFTKTNVYGNAIVGWTDPHWGSWPPNNLTPATPQDVFVNWALYGGDYHVLPAYAGAGANIDKINELLTGVN